ncbi:MAG: YebC/PmpR family DNA-binding transcriptional regulator [SAR202 cluster bacterium]|nr:YebC/PmpR family DNA-binding transcriptional regulator [Chloroflexota bacterium]MQG21998.1 YebC/PmpR family DNA-binding transcriptional regulator [SAR202 cluster bacterium]|tara:strand:- start:929 stop:1684 length:756 start_codon:yes stop_codon:yes gene_type:complete
MSGHSKWSTIKHKKAATDAKRGKLFTKLSKEIIVAAKQGGSDPEMNFRLRMAIQIAKDNNMPADNIDRAVKKGSGEGSEADSMSEITYEGYGPGGVGIMLQTLTDNKNRTVSDIRSTLTRAGGNMAESGAVAWQFEQKGVIIINVAESESEEIALIAIEQGAVDFETYDGTLHIYTEPADLEDIRSILTKNELSINSTELSMIPSSTIMLESNKALQTLKLLDTLEELEDVQKVYSNADFPEEALSNFEVV